VSNDFADRVSVVTRTDLSSLPRWQQAFSCHPKDHRYYEVVEDTLAQCLDHRYIVVRDRYGQVRLIQPLFVLDQDVLTGTPLWLRRNVERVRWIWPRFMKFRTLMVGCIAGEGRLGAGGMAITRAEIELLAVAVPAIAKQIKARLIVFKEFTFRYRASLQALTDRGFIRVPSLPSVTLSLGYADFEDYLRRGVSRNMRSHLRRKYRALDKAPPIEMSIVSDVSDIIDELYPLYLQVHHRSDIQFERLTKDFFCELGRRMPDRVRFFVWRQQGRVIAFSLSLIHNDSVHNEYLGLDYGIALKLHLYFVVFRDIMSWAISNGYKHYVSTSLCYDPKLHLRFRLAPLDLYVMHTSSWINGILSRVLWLLEPTRYDPVLPQFANYVDVWGDCGNAQAATRESQRRSPTREGEATRLTGATCYEDPATPT
jgi:hypothetical protein